GCWTGSGSADLRQKSSRKPSCIRPLDNAVRAAEIRRIDTCDESRVVHGVGEVERHTMVAVVHVDNPELEFNFLHNLTASAAHASGFLQTSLSKLMGNTHRSLPPAWFAKDSP